MEILKALIKKVWERMDQAHTEAYKIYPCTA